jgi:hypothetical protein
MPSALVGGLLIKASRVRRTLLLDGVCDTRHAGMESPRTAERLMTPTAVLIAVGGFSKPTTLVGFCLTGPPRGGGPAFRTLFPRDFRSGLRWSAGEEPLLPPRRFGEGACAMRVTYDATRRESGFESIVKSASSLTVVVLTHLGLKEVGPTAFFVAIATIVFGVRLSVDPVLARDSVSGGERRRRLRRMPNCSPRRSRRHLTWHSRPAWRLIDPARRSCGDCVRSLYHD